MSLNDSLANAMSKIQTYDSLGRKEVIIEPSSKVLKTVVEMLNRLGYLGSFEEVNNFKGGKLTLNLIGKINGCGVIKPRHPCKLDDYEKFEKRYLLAKDFGVLIVSTSKGMMTHTEAKEKKIGGKLIAYCY